jgi:hypothetical protein
MVCPFRTVAGVIMTGKTANSWQISKTRERRQFGVVDDDDDDDGESAAASDVASRTAGGYERRDLKNGGKKQPRGGRTSMCGHWRRQTNL